MADRDWDKELADIDKRLASIPEKQAPPPAARAEPAARPAPRAAPPPPPNAAVEAAERRTIGTPTAAGRRAWRTQLALLFRLAIGVGVIAAMLYWPYPSRCGAGLAYFLLLVAALALSGLWTSVSAWRHRAPFVHVVGLAMLTAAGILGAREVLPRVGYALPTIEHPASWACDG